jgi:hypothetical protein
MLLVVGVHPVVGAVGGFLDIAAQPFGLGLQVALLGDDRGAARGVLVPGLRSLRVAGHLLQMDPDGREAVVLGEAAVAGQGVEASKPGARAVDHSRPPPRRASRSRSPSASAS